MARKGENIYHRKDGRWEGRFIKGRNIEGRIKYGYIYGRTYKEVKKRLLQEKAKAFSFNNSQVRYQGTLGDWLDYWLSSEVAVKRKLSTLDSYSSKVNCHVRPLLGEIKLEELTLNHLQQFILKLEQQMSPASIHAVFRVLKTSLKFAEKMGIVTSTLYSHCQLPKIEKSRKLILSEESIKKITEKVKLSNHYLPVWIALETGLRIGEIAALKWKDIDFDNRVLLVQRTLQRVTVHTQLNSKSKIVETTPKTLSSKRKIPLGTQLCEHLQNKKSTSVSKYIVSDKSGYIEPRTIRNHFYKMLDQLNIDRLPFHSLRHTFATRALSQGISVSVISSLLGHASTQMTLDVYTCSTENEERAAVELLALR